MAQECPYNAQHTVDWEIFDVINFHDFKISVFNFRHLASILHCRYSVIKFLACLIFATRATGENFSNSENFPIYDN